MFKLYDNRILIFLNNVLIFREKNWIGSFLFHTKKLKCLRCTKWECTTSPQIKFLNYYKIKVYLYVCTYASSYLIFGGTFFHNKDRGMVGYHCVSVDVLTELKISWNTSHIADIQTLSLGYAQLCVDLNL
jgi:hypothetical protein